MTPTSSSAILPIPAGPRTFGPGAPGATGARRRRGFHPAP
jgi:hypothetical protein